MSDEFRPLEAHDAMTTVDERPMIVESWEGRIVDDRYRVREKIGEGGMGAVYAAEHLTLHKLVAFKTILPQYARDGEVSARFEREAMATGRLDHPHVAGAMDFGSLPDGGAYLVMQLVKGRSVEELLIADGGMSWARACSVGAQVADALSAAHQAGIVHRDLKPENVMIEERDDGTELALVLDFGIAQIKGEIELGGTTRESGPTPRAITRLGAIVGTPGYMAPEQALGEKTDERADLYSLGVLLWEMVTGRSLFDSNDVTEIVTEQLSSDLTTRVVEHTGDESTPPELQALIDQLLSRQPANRPQSAGEVRDALRELMMIAARGDRITLSRLTPVSGIRTDRGTPTRAPALDSMRGDAAVGSRWRAVAVFAITALLLTGIVGGVALMLGPSAEDEARTEEEQLQAMYELARHETLVQELARQQDIMLHNDDKDVRRQAALFVLDFEPADSVSVGMRAIAMLETSQTCSERAEALDGVIDAESGLARPAVQRWEDSGRCRRRNGRRVHCFACVRGKIREALEVLPPDPNAHVEEEAPAEEAHDDE